MIEQLEKRKIGCYLLVGILYFALALPFAGLDFNNGYSEIRFTGLLPMAAGMLFGLPGALACAFGNLAGDIYNGLDIYCTFGFIGNFLMAWLPYKLWHTLFFLKEHEHHYLDSFQSIIKFVCISIICSCASVGTIAAGGQLLHGFTYGSFFIPVAMQYYDLSLLGGMLIFQVCLSLLRIEPYISTRVYQQKYVIKRYTIDYILAGSIIVLSIILTYLTTFPVEVGSQTISALCMVFLVFTGILAAAPMVRSSATDEKVKERKYSKVTGLRSQFVMAFLMLLCIILIIIAAAGYRILAVDFKNFSIPHEEISIIWLRLIAGIGMCGTILILILGVFLRTIQQKVMDPVYGVTEYTKQFVTDEVISDKRLVIDATGNEIEELADAVNTMADNIRNFVEDIRVRVIEEGKMATELSIARNIQQGMLPLDWRGKGFDLVPYIKPAKEVGGDFYHFYEIDEEQVFVCIADVSGKDISAAMFMVQAKILIEAACNLPPNEMLAQVNDTLAKGNKAMLFVTTFAAVIDKKNKKMIYANAGHNAPICYNNGKSQWVDDEEVDFVLGAMAGIKYNLNTIDIAEDFKLFIYTDGVNEAESKSNEFLGNERMFQWVDKIMTEGASCKELIDQMETNIDKFTEDARQSDDITMMAVTLK